MPPRALPAFRAAPVAPPKRTASMVALESVPAILDRMEPGPVHPMAVREPEGIPEALDPALGVKPWERQPRETDSAWTLFVAFRDSAYPDGPLGRYVPRQVSGLAEALGLSTSYLRDLSSSFHWFARAGAWDRALDSSKTEADVSEVRRTRLRHVRLTAKARVALEGELDKWLHRSSDPEVASMSPREVLQGLELVVKMERLLVGEHTDHVKVDDGGWDLESLSLEDLEALDAVRRKAKGKG